ncbi:MAG: hypothetical protein ABW199_06000 [Caulobacterales bacterium]
MADVILTHAPEAAARAGKVAQKLETLGYRVRADFDAEAALSPHGRRKLAANIDSAAAVIVLWSKDAAYAPALIEAANRAKAKGKLALARLDTAAPSLGYAVDLSNWSGRDTRSWRSLVACLKTVSGAAPKKPASNSQRASGTPSATASSSSGKGNPAAGILLRLAALAALIGAGFGAYYYASSAGILP